MQNMQNSYRGKARVVAIVDLILTSVSLWIPIAIFLVITDLHRAEPQIEGDPEGEIRLIVIMLWVFFIATTLLVGVQLHSSIKLLIATELGQDPAVAVKQAEYWKYSTLVFTGFYILHFFFRAIGKGGVVVTLISIALRLYSLYIVQHFIREAELLKQIQVVPEVQVDGPGSAEMYYYNDTNNPAISQQGTVQGYAQGYGYDDIAKV